MKITNLSSRAVLIEFPTRKEMNLTCFRMSEFSEGKPELRKFYTPDVFIDLMSTKSGGLKYFSYWEGHNISVETIRKFNLVFLGATSKREDEVIKVAKNADSNGYIIFAVEGDEETIKHEKAHLFYHEHEDYKSAILEIINSMPDDLISEMKKNLIKIDYSEDVLDDEIQAYIIAFNENEFKEIFPKIPKTSVLDYSVKLNLIYNKFDT